MPDNEALKSLYNEFNPKLKLAKDYNEFSTVMSNENNRKAFFNEFNSKIHLAKDYDEFNKVLGLKKKVQSGISSVPTSPPLEIGGMTDLGGIIKQKPKQEDVLEIPTPIVEKAKAKYVNDLVYNYQESAAKAEKLDADLSSIKKSLSPKKQKDWENAQNIAVLTYGSSNVAPVSTEDYNKRQAHVDFLNSGLTVPLLGVSIGRTLGHVARVGEGLTKGLTHIVNGAAGIAADLIPENEVYNKKDLDATRKKFFDEINKYASYGLTEADKSNLAETSHLSEQLGGLAEFIAPEWVIGRASGLVKGSMYFLQGVGRAKETTDKFQDQGVELAPLPKMLYEYGSGVINAALVTKGFGLFNTQTNAIKNDIVSRASIELLKESMGNRLTGAQFKALLDKTITSIGDKGGQALLDYAAGYQHAAKTLVGLSATNYGLTKAADKLNEVAGNKAVFNETLENLAESTVSILKGDALLFGGLGSMGSVSKSVRATLFPESRLGKYTEYKNVVIDAISKDSSPENIQKVKQQVTELANMPDPEGNVWTQKEVDDTLQHIDNIGSTVNGLKNTEKLFGVKIKGNKLADAVDLVNGRKELEDRLAAIQEGKKDLDKSVANVISSSEQYLIDKIDQANDKLQETATGKQIEYEYDPIKDEYWKKNNGVFVEKINKSRYDLEVKEYDLNNRDVLDEVVRGSKVQPPSDNQIAKDLREKNTGTITYDDESLVPDNLKDKITERGEVNGKKFVTVTLPKSIADYELAKQKSQPKLTKDNLLKLNSAHYNLSNKYEDLRAKLAKDGLTASEILKNSDLIKMRSQMNDIEVQLKRGQNEAVTLSKQLAERRAIIESGEQPGVVSEIMPSQVQAVVTDKTSEINQLETELENEKTSPEEKIVIADKIEIIQTEIDDIVNQANERQAQQQEVDQTPEQVKLGQRVKVGENIGELRQDKDGSHYLILDDSTELEVSNADLQKATYETDNRNFRVDASGYIEIDGKIHLEPEVSVDENGVVSITSKVDGEPTTIKGQLAENVAYELKLRELDELTDAEAEQLLGEVTTNKDIQKLIAENEKRNQELESKRTAEASTKKGVNKVNVSPKQRRTEAINRRNEAEKVKKAEDDIRAADELVSEEMQVPDAAVVMHTPEGKPKELAYTVTKGKKGALVIRLNGNRVRNADVVKAITEKYNADKSIKEEEAYKVAHNQLEDLKRDIYKENGFDYEPEYIDVEAPEIVKEEVKQSKPKEQKANAIQKPSTESKVPPIREAGEVISESGEGVGQSKQGEKAPQEVVTEAPQQTVEQLREQEQAEYAAMDNPKDQVERKKIYDKYNKPITDAIREAKQEGVVEAPKVEVSKLQAAKDRMAAAKAKLGDKGFKLGISGVDPEQRAKDLIEYHKAIVDVAKEYIADAVNNTIRTAEQFAKEIGETFSKNLKDAWDEAKDPNKEAKTLESFMPKKPKEEVATEELTGISKEATALQRAQRDAEQIVNESGVKTSQQSFEGGRKLIESGQFSPRDAAKEILENKRNINDEEVNAFLIDRQTLINQRNDNLVKLNKAIEAGGDNIAINALRATLNFIDISLDNNERAVQIGARENARALAAMRAMISKDFDLDTQRMRMRNRFGGKLTPDMEAELERYDVALKKAQDELKQWRDNSDKADALRKVRAAEKASKTNQSTEAKAKEKSYRDNNKEKLNEAISKAIAESRKTMASGFKGVSDLAQIIATAAPFIKNHINSLIRDGVTDLDTITRDTIDNFKDVIDGVTDRDIIDVFRGAYDEKKKTKSQYTVERDNLKKVADLRAKIEDLENGVTRVEDTGKERKIQAKRQEIVDLTLKLKNLEDETGLTAEVAQRRRVKQLNADIEDIDNQIQLGKRTPAKEGIEYPNKKEIKELVDIRDRKQAELDDLDSRKNISLEKKLAQVNAKIASGDFSTTVAKEPIKLMSDKSITLMASVKRAQNNFDAMAKRIDDNAQSKLVKTLGTVSDLHRMFLLSGVTTLAKLKAFAIARSIITPIEEVLNTVNSKLPGLRSIAKYSPRYSGGLNTVAEVKAITTLLSMATFKDSWLSKEGVFASGSSNLDVLFGKNGIDRAFMEKPHMIEFFGRLHGAFKNSTKRAEFFRSLEKRLLFAARNGKDITDSDVIFATSLEAFVDAKKSILMGDNMLNDSYKGLLNNLKKDKTKNAGQVIAFALNWVLPIVKIPTNYALESYDFATGSIPGISRATPHILKAMIQGAESLTPQQADMVMRTIAKGQLGLAAMTFAYFNPQMFGGYYSGERKEGDLEAGDIYIAGIHIPHVLAHNPVIEAMQVAATVRRAVDEANGFSKVNGIEDDLTTNLRDKLVMRALEKVDPNNKSNQTVEVDYKKKTYIMDMKNGKLSRIREGISFTGQSVKSLLNLAEQVPFFSTPGQLSRGIESTNRSSSFSGDLVKNALLPRLLQEAAELTDRPSAFAKTIKRDPQTFWEHIKVGLPYLREQLDEINDEDSKINTITFDEEKYKLNLKQLEKRKLYIKEGLLIYKDMARARAAFGFTERDLESWLTKNSQDYSEIMIKMENDFDKNKFKRVDK